MTIPNGWKLVPVEPTTEMMEAYRRAISNYIETLPKETHDRVKSRPHGFRIKAKVKLRLRWRAMLDASPTPP